MTNHLLKFIEQTQIIDIDSIYLFIVALAASCTVINLMFSLSLEGVSLNNTNLN